MRFLKPQSKIALEKPKPLPRLHPIRMLLRRHRLQKTGMALRRHRLQLPKHRLSPRSLLKLRPWQPLRFRLLRLKRWYRRE